MRQIVIYGTRDQIFETKKNLDKNINEFIKRRVDVIYKRSQNFSAELYSYDGDLIMTVYDPAKIPLLLEQIDRMPIGRMEKALRENFSNVTSENAFDKRYDL